MKPIALTLIITLFLLIALVTILPVETAADGKPGIVAFAQRADACCPAKRGNVNGTGIIDSADLAALVSYLTGGGYVIPCRDAANVNGIGIIDSADLAALVSYLTGVGYILADCPVVPTLLTARILDVTSSTAVCGGTIISDGGGAVTGRGVCWSTSAMPTVEGSKTVDGTGSGSFQSQIAGLTPGTYYYVRAYATNSGGTGYGTEDSFTSSSAPPTVATTAVSSITQTTAQSGGTITSDGGSAVTARGVCWSTSPTPTVADNKTVDGTGAGSFTSAIAGLTRNTSYYLRAYATNGVGTGYGESVSFATLVDPPTVNTTPISALTQSTAECGGTVVDDGGAPVTIRGVCWSTLPLPTLADNKTVDGSGSGAFVSSISGLNLKTTYYARAYATNSGGTGYGSILTFVTTDSNGTMTDIDGNVYKIVKIGSQWWMAENLKVTHYQDGNPIPYGGSNGSIGYYCDYSGSQEVASEYGRLYNWYAVQSSHKVAPTGWHVASAAEWDSLVAYLSGPLVAGGMLKESGAQHWQSPNDGATDEVGFHALPGGYGDNSGFRDLGVFGYFWLADANQMASRILRFDTRSVVSMVYSINYSFSVRCVKGDVPAVVTSPVSAIGYVSAQTGGTITSDEGAPVTARGVCWSEHASPTTADNLTSDGAGTGSFTSLATPLAANTTNHLRAYATNAFGTGYGDELSFTSSPMPIPWITKSPMPTAREGALAAQVNGRIFVIGGWNPSIPAVLDKVEEYDASTDTWTPRKSMPTPRDRAAATTANGKVYVMGGWNPITGTIFNTVEEYDPVSDTWISKKPMPTARDGLAAAEVNGKIYAIGGFNASGDLTTVEVYDPLTDDWTTVVGMPTARTNLSAAVVNEKIYAIGGSYVMNFLSTVEEYDPSTDAWSASQPMPTPRDGLSACAMNNRIYALGGANWPTVYSSVEEYDPSTNIWRAKAPMPIARWGLASAVVNERAYIIGGKDEGSAVEEYSPALDPAFGTVTDVDGHVYRTVTIGTQVWMAENLKVTHYRNGDIIPDVTDNTVWTSLSSGAYCDYNDDVGNSGTYGRLYNWYAVADSRNIAPAGWHVASDSEWQALSNNLGGDPVAGGKLKEPGLTHWADPNTDATNESGFSGLPGGGRATNGSFSALGEGAYFWSSTPFDLFHAWFEDLSHDTPSVGRGAYFGITLGFSVRCVKDN